MGALNARPSVLWATAIVGALLASCTVAHPASCPAAGPDHTVTFSDGAILMRTPLAVNPDGAAASYVPGDHGYTYIANGVNLRDHGSKVSCSAAGNGPRCRAAWAEVEAGGFGQGTPEFCVFAMDVEPFAPGVSKVTCEGRDDRYIVGNGKGRPKGGANISSVAGDAVTSYLSTTRLTHTVQGEVVYVDSASIPGLVVPQSRGDLIGSLAWVRYGAREVFAIVNDTGPAFGEGSVALHQLLQSGEVGSVQPVGPIPLNLRCSAVETSLRAPFSSRPDLGDDDKCKQGYTARSPSDIRAYQGIDDDVSSIILSRVKPPMSGSTVTQELTLDQLRQWVAAAGYTPDKLNQMASCPSH